MELSELMHRVRYGDRDALKELIARYGGQVYKRALAKTGDKTLAKEVTQKTFAELVSTLQKNSDDEGWQLWLDTLAARNIDTCGRIKSDVSYVEKELERELYQEGQPHAAGQWQHAPARPQPYAPRDNARQVQGAYGRPAAPARPQPAAPQQTRYAAGQHAPRAPQPLPRRRPPESAAYPPPAQLVERPRNSFAYGLGVFVLIILCLALLWIAAGICMNMGFLPKLDWGYSWFNEKIFTFF